MRMPDPGPLGDTRFDASERAISSGDFVNKPSGGCVESVLTSLTQRRFVAMAILLTSKKHCVVEAMLNSGRDFHLFRFRVDLDGTGTGDDRPDWVPDESPDQPRHLLHVAHE